MTEKFCKITFHLRAKTFRSQACNFAPLYDVFGPMVIPYVVYLKKKLRISVSVMPWLFTKPRKNSTHRVGFHITQASIWHDENQAKL